MNTPIHPDVIVYLNDNKLDHKDIMLKLHDLIMTAVPDAKAEIKWGVPVYSRERSFCCIKDSEEHVCLGFYSRESLEKLDIKLDGSAKSMCHLSIRSEMEIKKTLLKKVLRSLANVNPLLLLGISKYIIHQLKLLL